jgi:heme/copper-type cytochrome/quinol oxidase subunit 3
MLIVPTLLILSEKMRAPNNTASTLKWATISAPLFVFALWFKYLFLWIDTLVPMNTHSTNPLSIVGTINALFTLLIAGVIITAGCVTLNKNRSNGKKLLSTGIILVGGFFIIFSIVAFFVPIYASFWYLTDFWMIILPILGITLLSYFKSK